MKKVYIIISAYNEEQNVEVLYFGLEEELSKINALDYEFVFVNDGSSDNTLACLLSIQGKNNKVTIINQSKNFGHELAMTAGLNYVAKIGKEKDFSVLFMDADMQHPPKLAAELVRQWQKGEKLILTKRIDNEDSGYAHKVISNFYYWMLNILSDVKIPRNMPDFRLLDKKYVLWIDSLTETDRMFRGMLSLVGLKDACVIEFNAPKRNAGKSKYNFLNLYKLAIDSIIQFSIKPLRVATVFGVLGCLLSILFLFYSIYVSYVNNEPKTGYLTLLSISVFFSSLTILFLGIIGEYIGRIHIEVKNRPLYFNEIIKDES